MPATDTQQKLTQAISPPPPPRYHKGPGEHGFEIEGHF